MRRILFILMICSFILMHLLFVTDCYAQTEALSVNPEMLNIGTFFSGGDITISGCVPDGQDVFIEIIGPAAKEHFDVKGRLGPFWMTRDKAELDGAPSLYILLLPDNHSDALQTAASLGLGLDSLRKKISIESTTMTSDNIYRMFLDLKKSEGLYGEKEKTVTYADSEKNTHRFIAVFHFPSSTAPGQYMINATYVEHGSKQLKASLNFPVEEIGFIRLVDDLANDRRLLYGILAVIIALFAGAVMGVLFKGGGGH